LSAILDSTNEWMMKSDEIHMVITCGDSKAIWESIEDEC